MSQDVIEILASRYHVVNSIDMPHIERMSIGMRLKELRKEARLTQIELAETSGVPQGTISRIESGSYKEIPPPEIINPLARSLSVDAGRLLEAAGFEMASGTESQPVDPQSETIARAVRNWTPAQKKLLWNYIEAVSAALDQNEQD
jgi:transcriptional regulator with XRE-family HTH domain